ncbi:hypothetical protein [Frigoriglobus tundricola]|uniref:PI-PLC Y-box domain-containing protein n=1 Tax=Frigoriglobus tundricola TaxID=2774151 RepID=A0A6M5Z465_9BACT|nr:hypothetical protein [Frigoriglobus tundricola]QJX00567.1 hypothetical protein FTUN_8197 [Frigoriglobus tundricola]
MELSRQRSPGWAYLVCAVPVLISGGVYGAALPYYPVPYQDESFYPAPAASAVSGGPFAHATRPDAPHGDRLWAYHGPLYPRLLVPVFRTVGVSIAAARAPQFLAAYLAVLLLCATLLGRNYTWTSVLVAVAWVGDRSQQEVLFARMEGLCLLCLVAGYWGLLNSRRGGFVAAGAALTASCGFQPVALFFPAAGWVWALAHGRRAAVGYTAGAGLAAVVTVLAVGPDPAAAFEQFRWHAGLYATNQSRLTDQVVRLFRVLHWSGFWAAAVVIVTTGLGIGTAVSVARHRRLVGADPVARAAALFAICGLLGFVVLARCAFPYNLVTLTLWPVVAVGAALESRSGGARWWLRVAALLLVAGWLPSAAWNLVRTRELVLWARSMDTGPARESLRRVIPEGQTVGVDRYVGLFGWSLGREVVLLPWHEPEQHPRPDLWLLVTDVQYKSADQLAPDELARRPIVLETTLYPPSCPINQKLILLGPVLP